MLLLSIDSSAVTASAALTENGNVIRSELINQGLTHSETLLPLIEKVMGNYEFGSLDAIAVTVGPGSFTGIRIGIATVKGLAFPNNTYCIPISSPEAIAYNFAGEDAVVCALMDARRNQFYSALFKSENGKIIRLTQDSALPFEEIEHSISDYKRVIAAGDGAELFCSKSKLKNIELASHEKRFQCGTGVAGAAENKKSIPAAELMPVYLRMSQAERELKLKKSKGVLL
ncbi:MAG: tRNA (adenosine(37)-N6)-threonylcarbamoyltransferase complex dimerization subunit type 1 TsaB [Clostridiales bacterium]|nr:tRNA (adenosine(37)-N6)-threonylcarbamoyltransferase complex dimerization subunit type 1 TsaB [Clostridiales bacterium]